MNNHIEVYLNIKDPDDPNRIVKEYVVMFERVIIELNRVEVCLALIAERLDTPLERLADPFMDWRLKQPYSLRVCAEYALDYTDSTGFPPWAIPNHQIEELKGRYQ